MKNVVLYAGGKIEILEGHDPLTLKELQRLVGGDIEGARIGDHYVFVNEEGMIPTKEWPLGLPENISFPQFARRRGKRLSTGTESRGCPDEISVVLPTGRNALYEQRRVLQRL